MRINFLGPPTGTTQDRQSPAPHVFELKDVISLLRSEVKRAGGQSEWARQTGISRPMLNKVLNGRKSPTMTIIAALKLRMVFVSDPNPPKWTTPSPKGAKRGFTRSTPARAGLKDEPDATDATSPRRPRRDLSPAALAAYSVGMSDLTLRPTWPEHCATGRPVDDFSVRHAGRPVGRIYQTCGPQTHWFWGLHGLEPGTPRGQAPSLEEAKFAFKTAYAEWSTRAPVIEDRG
jgi:hypothetical protein